jgi:glycosyltransferase involved in cell wall biosynthesis
MSTTPLVSIGLFLYNGDRFLAAAIESILNQTFQDFELIISDNCSTDRSEEICRKFAAHDDSLLSR